MRKIIYTLVLFLFQIGFANGQSSSVTGSVLDVDNNPMGAASVTIEELNLLFNLKTEVSRKNFDISFWVRNAFNKRYLSYSYPSDNRVVLLGIPRTMGLTLTSKF